jgi:cell division protein FtsW
MSARQNAIRATEAQGALLAAVGILAACGAVAVFSATAPLALDHAIPPHFLRHVAALAIGGIVAFGVAWVPLSAWRALSLPIYALSLIALAATLGIGTSAGGATRWLVIPGLGTGFQPAEVVKLTTVLAVAFVLSRRDGRAEVTGRQLLTALGLAALPAALCLFQPDLGSAVILCVLAGGLLFVAGARMSHLALPAICAAAGMGLYVAVRPYALRRWVGFLDPWSRASTEGFQLVQSFVAFGRGGVGGVGVGDGRQKLFYLPEAHNDFILSVVAEETGLIGVVVILGAFVALLVAGLRIALATKDRFALLLGAGATMVLTLPAVLNAAVVMGCLPTKGLTLPFLSYGRTSLLVSCLAIGLLVAVARPQLERRRR